MERTACSAAGWHMDDVTLARIQKNHATTQPLSRLGTTLESLGARAASGPWSHEFSPKTISSAFR